MEAPAERSGETVIRAALIHTFPDWQGNESDLDQVVAGSKLVRLPADMSGEFMRAAAD